MKKVIALLVFVFLLSFVVYSVNATETRLIWNLDWEGLSVAIYSPYQAYPNESMTIRIRVEAREALQDVTVSLSIYGSMSEGYILWYRPLEVSFEDLPLGIVEDQYFNVSIPETVDPGSLHALTSCSWKVWRESSWQERSIDDICIHRVAYIRNKPYEELQVAHDQLLADHNFLQNNYNDLENSYIDLQANYSTLLADYDELLRDFNNLRTSYESLNSTYYSLLYNHSSLQASFNELKSKYEFAGEIANSLNLMYVFIETTVIFIATTIYYARSQIYSALRKTKPKQLGSHT